MGEETGGRERRQTERFSCAGEAEIVVPGNGLRFAGQIANLSATGCFIETTCRLERGTSVEVWIRAEGLPLRVAANLLVRRPGGVGLKFHSLTERRREQIGRLIAELAAARAKEAAATEVAITEPVEAMLAEAEEEVVTPLPVEGAEIEEVPRLRRLRRILYSMCVRWREFAARRKAIS